MISLLAATTPPPEAEMPELPWWGWVLVIAWAIVWWGWVWPFIKGMGR